MKLTQLFEAMSMADLLSVFGRSKETLAEIDRATQDARNLPSYKKLIEVVPECERDIYIKSLKSDEIAFGPLEAKSAFQSRNYYWKTGADGLWKKLNIAHRTVQWATSSSSKTGVQINSSKRNSERVLYDSAIESYDWAFKEILKSAEFELKLAKSSRDGWPD